MKKLNSILAMLSLAAISEAQTSVDLVHFIENNESRISCTNCSEAILLKVCNEPTGGKLIYNDILEVKQGLSAGLGRVC